jgi:hypothetical protein
MMSQVNPKIVARFKKIFKKEYGVEYSDDEAREAIHNIVGLFDLLLIMDKKQNSHLYERNSGEQGMVRREF